MFLDDSIAVPKSSKINVFMYDHILTSGGLSTPESTSSSNQPLTRQMVTTPGFIKAVCFFIYNLMRLAPGVITVNLHEFGLIKMFFR